MKPDQIDSPTEVYSTIPPGEESVLDFIKSKFRLAKEPEREIAKIDLDQEPAGTSHFPWRSLLAIGLSLAGQKLFEPPRLTWELGVACYVLGIASLIWAIRLREWQPVPLRSKEFVSESWKVNSLEVLAAGILGLVAFAMFSGNLFTPLNISLWIISIILLFKAFWVKRKKANDNSPSDPLITEERRWSPKPKVWMILVLVVTLIVVFFRIYQINEIPAEPFSDHAEKILDVFDISRGQTHIFFPRNTGREALQMYLTFLVAKVFGTGLSFLSLKFGTVLCGILTLPYIYLAGKEIGNKYIGLIALFLAGIAYWPNVISRVGLRFPLYPLFVAPVFYYMLRGLRRANRNDFLLAGLFLGLGLHGYSPFRIVPLLVIVGFGLYILHRQSRGMRFQALIFLGFVVVVALFIFLPLLRYWIENPDVFSYRAFSRLGSVEQSLPGDWWQILISNFWNALRMFNWSDGEIWVNSVPYRPALDVVTCALFIIGLILIISRYFRERNWQDLFLVLSIPILMLPSILSLAYPAENPALNRTGGAIIPVFMLAAIALEGLFSGLKKMINGSKGIVTSLGIIGLLLGISLAQNYKLVFIQYNQEYRNGTWNSSEMGAVIKQFGQINQSTDYAWIVPYPHWVDTRLPGIWAGIPDRDFAIWPENLGDTLGIQGEKLFIYNLNDITTGQTLETLYPQGISSRYSSKTPNHDFMIYTIPAQ